MGVCHMHTVDNVNGFDYAHIKKIYYSHLHKRIGGSCPNCGEPTSQLVD